ncbi:MAG: PKD domain-containing protein, partial [Thermoplasmata archaeon]|nr:PKD domain-containing protein [Thermoplasmata archaeon]
NAFKDNNGTGWQVVDRGTDSFWDFFGYGNGYGNWWSDYEDRYPNATHDGRVWDTPYNDMDMYPLVRHSAFPEDGAPVAVAGPDQTVDQGATVHFNGNLSTDDRGIVSWTWSFLYDDETVSLQGVSPSFQFSTVGIYVVTLVVMDAASRWDADTLNITVLDVTDPVAIAIDRHVPGEPTAHTFDGLSSRDNVGIVNWTWTIEDEGGPVVLYGDLVEHTFGGPGYFLVELRVVDAAGNEAFDSLFVTISDREDPVAEAGPDQEVEMGDWVTLNGSASTDNIGIADHLWSFWYLGSTVLLSGVTVQHYFGEAGMYTIGLRVTDMTGNTHDDIVLIVVLDTEP